MQQDKASRDRPQKADWQSPITKPLDALNRNAGVTKILEEDDGRDGESNYLFRKLEDAFEVLTEKIVDQFTLSEFAKFKAGDQPEKTNKKTQGQVEWLIHNLRSTIRTNFKATFLQLCDEMKVRECLQAAGTEIEKQRILRELESLTGSFVTEGADHYFDFLQNVLSRLTITNDQLAKGVGQPLSEQHRNLQN